MSVEDKNGCLHGNDGKFIPKGKTEYRQNTNYAEILFDDKNQIKNETGLRKEEKGIRSLKKVIADHEEKINKPEIEYPAWNTFTEKEKSYNIVYWKREIKRYKKQIDKKQKRINDYYERKRT